MSQSFSLYVCSSAKYQCLKLLKRHDDVIEFHEGSDDVIIYAQISFIFDFGLSIDFIWRGVITKCCGHYSFGRMRSFVTGFVF